MATMPCLAQIRAMSASSSRVNTRPCGLPGVEAVVRLREGHEARRDGREHASRHVILVPGLQDQGLVAGLGQREDRGGDRLRDAAGDRDLVRGIGADPVDLRRLARDRLAQRRRAPRERVLMVRGIAERRRERARERRGRREVRQPLGEIDAADLLRQPRHLADDGFLEGLGAGGEGLQSHGDELCEVSSFELRVSSFELRVSSSQAIAA
jgi:hypothetical protein